jgi:hypothetical protein
MKKIFLTLALAAGLISSAQVKIGNNVTSVNANSILDLEATNKGLLFPRVALTGTTNVSPLTAHVAGMTVYNIATAGDVTPGLYTNSGSAWVSLSVNPNAALNVTAELTTSYTALISDDIILVNYNTGGLNVTLPTSGIPIGKKYYISNIGNSDCGFNNTLRGTGVGLIPGQMSGTVMYTGSGFWAIISTQ